MFRQNILLSNANKSDVYNLNNDIYLNFPTNLFFKTPKYIELIDMDINAEISLFGNSNNTLFVNYKGTKHIILVEYSTNIKTDYDLALLLQDALNNPRNPNDVRDPLPYTDNDLTFSVTESSIENILTNFKIEREAFTTAYTIIATSLSRTTCTIDFSSKDSIGPLIGFGNGIYLDLPISSDGLMQINGTSVPSISAYNFVEVTNISGGNLDNLPAGPFPEYGDVNCKMVLYNSNKQIIPNSSKLSDMTISLNIGKPSLSYENIGEVLRLIEIEMNKYANEFSPAANFKLLYDIETSKITISNTTGAKFGIGFDFENITRQRVMYSSVGLVWNNSNSINNNNWQSISSSDDLKIITAVASLGNSDRFMYSTDNLQWKKGAAITDNNWTSITWAPSLNRFVAIATYSLTSKAVMVSSDYFTWYTYTVPSNNWTSVCWSPELSLFAAVASSGTGNRVMTSTDGINWTSRTSAADNKWTSVCWSSSLNLFVAVASSGTNNRIMTSSDGINWTIRTSPANNNWTCVIWAHSIGLFVAVASSGIGNRIMTSSNGITWTIRSSPANNNWTSVCWAPEINLFAAVASSGTNNRIMTSPNGITWSIVASPADNDWTSIIWDGSTGNKKFVALAKTGLNNRIMSSVNGINWGTQTSQIDNLWNSLVYAPSLSVFVAVASSGTGNRVMYSPDGLSWSSYNMNIGWTSVCYGNLKFVAVANTGTTNRAMSSVDGIYWTHHTTPNNNNWTSVCYGNGIYVAVANSGIGNRVMTSTDGSTWVARTSAADYDWMSVCYGNNLFVAVASTGNGGGRVMTSPDGITWTLRNSPSDNNWSSVCWSPTLNLYVAVATLGNSRAMYSSNGINWNLAHTPPALNEWTSVCWYGLAGSPKFIAVSKTGMGNRVSYSVNGSHWTTPDPNTTGIPANLVTSNIEWNCVHWVNFTLEGSSIFSNIFAVGSSFGNSSGSLHYILGFDQKSYYDVDTITSINSSLTFSNIFADDYMLICSNIMNNSTDINVIGIGNANNIKSNNIIFAIPLKYVQHFKPVDSSYYRIDISASAFSQGYKNRKFTASNPNLINFYLRLLSGRHITCTSQFTMQLSFLY
jgi:hypothetical protein